MLISRQIHEEMTKSLFVEKPRYGCKNQVPSHFSMETQNGDMDHTKPLEGFGGLDMDMKGEIFKFSSLLLILIRPYFGLSGLIWSYLDLFGPNKVK